ncbi:hypothetical protein AYI68_g4430 [Smittium mucronatum]|uniref:Uncharacterized protein n=1 Tax=Smittium mucronatum TaxID=133383 RepID=A0A1R0GX96_9FUNG|nr:hypothetical protein AYI68_g4430 [Smittium mucronatum]
MERFRKFRKSNRKNRKISGEEYRKTLIAQIIVLQRPYNTYFNKTDHIIWTLENFLVKQTLKQIKRNRLEVVDIIFDQPLFDEIRNSKDSSQDICISSSPNKRIRSEVQLATSGKHFQEDTSDLSIQNEKLFINKDLEFIFTENTYFYFLEEKYKHVFVIDVSDSMFSLDIETGKPLIDLAIDV